MNKQPIEKQHLTTGESLSVHGAFHTIQGEGPFCGTPAVFIRLAGCNLQCPSCDTDYTSNRFTRTPIEILEAVQLYMKEGLVVITGGEPFRQSIGPLINLLTECGYYVQVETNGTLAPSEDVAWNTLSTVRKGAYIVCSPKTGKVQSDIAKYACCYKYVIEADSVHEVDGLPLRALRHTAHPHVARPPAWWYRPVYLQPMDSKDESANRNNLKAAINSCMAHGYILQLQVHKLIGME